MVHNLNIRNRCLTSLVAIIRMDYNTRFGSAPEGFSQEDADKDEHNIFNVENSRYSNQPAEATRNDKRRRIVKTSGRSANSGRTRITRAMEQNRSMVYIFLNYFSIRLCLNCVA